MLRGYVLSALVLGAAVALVGCGADKTDSDHWRVVTKVDPSAATRLTHGAWSAVTQPGTSGQLTMEDAHGLADVRVASRALRAELPDAALAGEPVRLTLKDGTLGVAGAWLSVRRRRPLPPGRAVALVYLDPATSRWVPVQSNVSAGRRVTVARVHHFSIWDSIEYGAGWLLDRRVSPPRCGKPRPGWVDDVTFLDDKIAPLRWCAGQDPDHRAWLQVKLAVNRSYGVGAEALATPEATQASVFGGGPSELLNGLAGRVIQSGLEPLTRTFGKRIPVMGGQEIAFSFSEAQVRARQGRALVHVSLDAADTAAGIVYWALSEAGLDGKLGIAMAYATAYAAVAQCEADTLRPLGDGHIAEGLAGLAGCLTSHSETTAKLAARALAKQFPHADPRELGDIAAKAGRALKYVELAGIGFKVATWLTDRKLIAAAFEAHAFAVVPRLAGPWGPNQEGYGKAHPSVIFNGGDPTGMIRDIHWTGWGTQQATGTGQAEYVWPGTSVADNGFSPATVVAYRLGTCHGRPTYNAVQWYFPQYGERFDPSEPTYNLCTGEAPDRPYVPLPRCPDSPLHASLGTATEVQARGIDCDEVARLIAVAPVDAYLQNGGRFEQAGFRCGTQGFGDLGIALFDCSDGVRELLYEVDER